MMKRCSHLLRLAGAVAFAASATSLFALPPSKPSAPRAAKPVAPAVVHPPVINRLR